MLSLNKPYSAQEIAKAIDISYSTFRNDVEKYEQYLDNFYSFVKTKGKYNNSTIYTLTEEKLKPFISYKEYKKQKRQVQKSNILQPLIHKTIAQDNRQTGSNIARIIFNEDAIQVFDWQLSTLTLYTREELRHLLDDLIYIKEDYKWCILNKNTNIYELMDETEIKELRSYIDNCKEEEENFLADEDLTEAEKQFQLYKFKKEAFLNGCRKYYRATGKWPQKVPVYSVNAMYLKQILEQIEQL